MKKSLIVLIWVLLVGACSDRESAPLEQLTEEPEGAHEEHEETTISSEMAARFGLETRVAGPVDIVETVRVFGRVKPVSSSDVTIRARFPGRAESVAVDMGDSVSEGAILATVESNESLKPYPIVAPSSGVIAERWINPGEQTGERALFRIVDLREVWVDFALFPTQRESASVSQLVTVRMADGRLVGETKIDWIGLEVRPDQAVMARATLTNIENLLVPGMLVSGDLTLATHPVAIAVSRKALQTSGAHAVVYVQVGDRYESRAVRLGREDDLNVEIVDGLIRGERYVSENSYLVKADIEKAGAGHEH